MNQVNHLSAEAPDDNTSAAPAKNSGESRRDFLRRSALAGAASLIPVAGLLQGAEPAFAAPHVGSGDVAILKFLAAAELVEEDLWQQYTELANNNPGFHDAISEIDDAMPQYSSDTTNDEHSHAAFINAFLEFIGEEPVDLNAFRTLPSAPVQGAQQIGRLTNLTNLTVDTSWYNRYRSTDNPDFGDSIPQIVTIVNRTAIPTSDSMTTLQLQTAVRVAAFHFPTIEQGGMSLYPALLAKVRNIDTLRILAAIGPTEAVHFSIFHDALEDIEPFDSGDGFTIPVIDDETRHAVMPRPCKFRGLDFPFCSVARPTLVRNAGASAAARALMNSNLFQGQSAQFFQALNQLAAAADAASRGF